MRKKEREKNMRKESAKKRKVEKERENLVPKGIGGGHPMSTKAANNILKRKRIRKRNKTIFLSFLENLCFCKISFCFANLK